MSDVVKSSQYMKHITLITKPEQSGKTFLMLQQIVECYSKGTASDGFETINFIVCDNNLLLVLQTGSRIDNDANMRHYKNKDTGDVYLEFSSSKSAGAKKYTEVQHKILFGNIRTILCCANYHRWMDAITIINEFESCPLTKNKYKYNFWIDEADKFMTPIRSKVIPLTEKYDCVEVYLLTATSPKIVQDLGTIRVFPIENTTTPNYNGWKDNKIIPVLETVAVSHNSYIEYILKKYPSQITPGSKWFIPAQKTKKSHKITADTCLKYGFAVAVINGNGFTIYIPGHEPFTNKKDRISETLILDMYRKYKLDRFPFAITGQICVSRGITINSKQFMITHAIMPWKIEDESECSQLAGRMKGNFKDWENYKPARIYTTLKNNTVAMKYENFARKLGRYSFEEDDPELRIVTQQMIEEFNPTPKENIRRTITIEEKYSQSFVSYTQEEVISKIKDLFPNARPRMNKKGIAPKTLRQSGDINPTYEQVITRWWGISETSPFRILPLNDGRWIGYWIKI
jgi:hypothetical protein